MKSSVARSHQSGVTLFEVVVYVGLLSAIALGAAQLASDKAFRSDYRIAYNDARVVAAQADLFRQQVAASVPPATINDAWTYTFDEYTDFVDVQDLIDDTGWDMPTETPWGSRYEVRADDRQAVVRYQVPAEHSPFTRGIPSGTERVDLGGGVAELRVTNRRRDAGMSVHRPLRLKSQYYGEDTRS